jgi:hypothetical protein
MLFLRVIELLYYAWKNENKKMSMDAGLILFIYFKNNVIISLYFKNMKISIDHLSMVIINGYLWKFTRSYYL